MTPEIETLDALAQASSKCFTLALHDAYKTLPKEHIASLQKQGFWYVASATQGNLTEKGAKVLKAHREQLNHKAVTDALIEDGAKLGLTIAPIPGRTSLTVTMKDGYVLTLTKPAVALFIVEERLVQAGKIV